jgi:hypothetical protein
MRKCNLLIMSAMLGSTLLIFAGGFSPASAGPRVTLGQCIENYWSCQASCWDWSRPLPPGPGLGYCYSTCWDNHAVCLDLAFSSSAATAGDQPTTPSKRRAAKKRSD